MKRILVILACVAVAIAGLTAPIAAQTEADTEGCEQLDSILYLCEQSVQNEEATFVVVATEDTEITLTDTGRVVDGGSAPSVTHELEEGERTTITHPAVRVLGGYQGVSIATYERVHGQRLSEPASAAPQLPGEPNGSDWATGGLTVLTVTIAGLMMIARWFKRKNGGVIDVF